MLVHFEAENIIDCTRASSISWVAVNVIGAPPNTAIASKEFPPGQYNEFDGSLSLPLAFPVGSYSCSLHVDGYLVQSIDFMVKE